MTTLFAFLIGLSQGLLHALGPDHCAAIVSLESLSERKRRAALTTALHFAAGHALVLGLVAGTCLLAGVGLSESFERWAEIGGGAVLLGLAVAALLFPSTLEHGHPHLGAHAGHHHHPQIPMAAGALMAFSGVRSLLLALPPLLVGGRLSLGAWVYLPGFALGVFAGMLAVGLVVAEGFGRLGARATAWAQRGAAVLSGATGVYWMAQRL